MVDGPGVVDNVLIKQVVVNGDKPNLKIYTTDNTKVGYQKYFIRASFNVPIPYYIDSPSFMIYILHQCVKNVIIGRTFPDKSYNVSRPQLSFK